MKFEAGGELIPEQRFSRHHKRQPCHAAEQQHPTEDGKQPGAEHALGQHQQQQGRGQQGIETQRQILHQPTAEDQQQGGRIMRDLRPADEGQMQTQQEEYHQQQLQQPGQQHEPAVTAGKGHTLQHAQLHSRLKMARCRLWSRGSWARSCCRANPCGSKKRRS